MATYIRLTHFKSSEEKKRGFFDPKNRYEAKQGDFEKIPGSPIAYWVSDRIKEIFENRKLNEIGYLSEGIKTGDNETFLRQWHEININDMYLNNNLELSKWISHHKGGEFRKWYGNKEFVINWENDGKEIKKWTGSETLSEIIDNIK